MDSGIDNPQIHDLFSILLLFILVEFNIFSEAICFSESTLDLQFNQTLVKFIDILISIRLRMDIISSSFFFRIHDFYHFFDFICRIHSYGSFIDKISIEISKARYGLFHEMFIEKLSILTSTMT